MIGKIDIALSVSLDTVNITFALSYWREKNRERCLYYTKILELDFSAFPFLFLLPFPDVFCFPFWLLPSSLRRRALAPPVLGLLGGLIRNVFGEPGGLIFISFSYCMVTLFGGGDGARFDSKSDKMKIHCFLRRSVAIAKGVFPALFAALIFAPDPISFSKTEAEPL